MLGSLSATARYKPTLKRGKEKGKINIINGGNGECHVSIEATTCRRDLQIRVRRRDLRTYPWRLFALHVAVDVKIFLLERVLLLDY